MPEFDKNKPREDQFCSASVNDLILAKKIYQEQKILGSDDKDIWGASKAKIIGAEIDSSLEARQQGLATAASPVRKRLALAFISLELAKMRFTSDALWACLIGGWTSCLMYRRPFMSLFAEVYKLVKAEEISQDSPKLVPLPRRSAQEVLLAAVLCPLFSSDLSARLLPKLYSTDSSDAKGAVVSRPLEPTVARVIKLGSLAVEDIWISSSLVVWQ